jgi:hypothetical protein
MLNVFEVKISVYARAGLAPGSSYFYFPKQLGLTETGSCELFAQASLEL